MEDELTDDEVEALREVLRTLQRELGEQSVGAGDRSGTVHLDQAAVGRISRVDAMQQQQMARAEQRRIEVRLEQIGRALKRIDDGDFGSCVRCEEPIARRRLHARPETPFCVACASELGA